MISNCSDAGFLWKDKGPVCQLQVQILLTHSWELIAKSYDIAWLGPYKNIHLFMVNSRGSVRGGPSSLGLSLKHTSPLMISPFWSNYDDFLFNCNINVRSLKRLGEINWISFLIRVILQSWLDLRSSKGWGSMFRCMFEMLIRTLGWTLHKIPEATLHHKSDMWYRSP